MSLRDTHALDGEGGIVDSDRCEMIFLVVAGLSLKNNDPLIVGNSLAILCWNTIFSQLLRTVSFRRNYRDDFRFFVFALESSF